MSSSTSGLVEFVARALLAHWLLGAALVLVVALALRAFAHTNAATRHMVWLVTLCALLLLPGSFFLRKNPVAQWLGAQDLASSLSLSGPTWDSPLPVSQVQGSSPLSDLSEGGRYQDPYGEASATTHGLENLRTVALLVGFLLACSWLLWTCFLVFCLIGALCDARRLRLSSREASQKVRAFVLELARSAGLEPVPEVAIGKQQIGPACVGFAKPQILLPENWPRGLSPAAERNALWHELAHVARRDGWLMLGQRVAEAFLAFHPAAWWVSRQLELERESACDDWAAARAGVDVVEYGESLLECVELLVGLPKRATENYLVAGWIRSPSQLKRRLFNMTNSQRGHHATVHPLAIGLLAATFCIAALGTASAWPVLPGTLANSGSGAVVSGAVEEWNDERLSADDSPLFSAVRSGDPEIVRALLDAGQSANQIWPGDGSPLIVAARQGDREMVQLLIDEGADVDLGVGGDGTPLIQAAAHGYRDIVDLLLSHGANVDAHGRGGDGNPIIQASLNGKRDLVKYLAERGAAIDIHIKNDDTPLINAAQQGHVGVVKLLLELGADPNLEGDFDRELGKVRTPLNQARANGHNNVARLLQSSGANG